MSDGRREYEDYVYHGGNVGRKPTVRNKHRDRVLELYVKGYSNYAISKRVKVKGKPIREDVVRKIVDCEYQTVEEWEAQNKNARRIVEKKKKLGAYER